MRQKPQVTETMSLRVSSEDKAWMQKRADSLKLRPAIYARMLLSKAVEIDMQEPGKLFTGTLWKEIVKTESCELPARATKAEHQAGILMRHISHSKVKKLPSPKACADCGGFLPLSFDPDARRYFDHSTLCHCRAMHGAEGIAWRLSSFHLFTATEPEH